MNIREHIRDQKLILDGAMGTYFEKKYPSYLYPAEMANLKDPEYVLSIHRDYIEAGADMIKTNTFSANPENNSFAGDEYIKIIREGCRIARQAVEESGRDVGILADIGPVSGTDASYKKQILKKICDLFIEEGISDFIFETNSNSRGIRETAEYIRSRIPDAYIIVSFAVQTDGYTLAGLYYMDLFRKIIDSGAVDAVGTNCVISALHMYELLKDIDKTEITLCAMPNGGYPRVSGRKIYYESDPGYFCDQTLKIAASGVNIIGGCCGTDPGFIRELSKAVRSGIMDESPVKVRPLKTARQGNAEQNRLWSKIKTGKKIIAVELDTPRESRGETFMSGAWQLKSAGVDAITLADCPTARARMDSSLMACKLKRELDIDPIPHLTCRDRNINATKALLLGLSMEGVNNVLLITGDPIPSTERSDIKSVYQFNSRILAGFVSSLNNNELSAPFRIYGALNVNAVNFDVQIEIAKNKIEKGMTCLLTQPVLNETAFENLKRAREELDVKILGGIIPVVSSRNARFMNSEISGIDVSEKIIEMYEGKDRAECTKLAIDISSDIAERIMPYVDGYYLVTPFNRVDIITEIVKNIRRMSE